MIITSPQLTPLRDLRTTALKTYSIPCTRVRPTFDPLGTADSTTLESANFPCATHHEPHGERIGGGGR